MILQKLLLYGLFPGLKSKGQKAWLVISANSTS